MNLLILVAVVNGLSIGPSFNPLAGAHYDATIGDEVVYKRKRQFQNLSQSPRQRFVDLNFLFALG